MALFALHGAEGGNVVAVGDGVGNAVAHEGGAGILQAFGVDDGAQVGGEQAVGDVDGGVSPADEAAALVGGVARGALDATVEEATRDVGGAARP